MSVFSVRACAPEGTGDGGGGALILSGAGPAHAESAEAKLTNQAREILAH